MLDEPPEDPTGMPPKIPSRFAYDTSEATGYASPDGGDHWTAIVRDLPVVLSVEVQTQR